MKTKLFSFFCVTIFAIGLVAFSTRARQKGTNLAPKETETARLAKDALAPRAFRATQIETYIDREGNETVRHIRIRRTSEDGTWSEVWQSVGREGQTIHTGNPATGEYTVGDTKESMTLPNTESASSRLSLYRNPEFLAGRKGFQGKEKIAGLDAYVFRGEIKDHPGMWIETAHAPETGPFYLRMIQHNPDGSEVRIETVSVKFK
jgi:hypothetical protein